MKKTICVLLCVCLLLLCACVGAPIQEDNLPPNQLGLIRPMTPAQGGDMLYPVYGRSLLDLWWPSAEMPQEERQEPAFLTMMGLIGQNGTLAAAPQFVSVVYYTDADGRAQYVFAFAPDEQCTVYALNGSVYDRFPARAIHQMVSGVPYVVVSTKVGFGEGDGYESVYSIEEKKLLFADVYFNIQFVDRRTLWLARQEKKDGEPQYTDDARREDLYDLTTGTLTPLHGFVKAVLSENVNEHTTHLPAVKVYAWDALAPEGFLSRAGAWTTELPQGAVLPREMAHGEAYTWYGTDSEDTLGGHYKWQENLTHQGYVDETGEWVWREKRQYAFLED